MNVLTSKEERLFKAVALSSLCSALLAWPEGGPVVPATAAEVDFEKQVRPLLQKYCFGCHGEKQQKGDLRLDTLTTDFLRANVRELEISRIDFWGTWIGMPEISNGRVLIHEDGCHNGSVLAVYTERELKKLGKFQPSHLTTSGYDSSMAYPFVDGRLIMRGRNRLYCYDLRTKTKPEGESS